MLQKICYHTRVKSEGECGVSHHCPALVTSVDPRGAHPTTSRLLANAGKLASSRWHVTSHCWPRAGESRGKRGARYEVVLLR